MFRSRGSTPWGKDAPAGVRTIPASLASSTTRVAVPLVANDELLGLLRCAGTSQVDLARAVASQTAVAIKKIELIERLTEKNLIKDFLEQLAAGAPAADVEGRAARLGADLDHAGGLEHFLGTNIPSKKPSLTLFSTPGQEPPY